MASNGVHGSHVLVRNDLTSVPAIIGRKSVAFQTILAIALSVPRDSEDLLLI